MQDVVLMVLDDVTDYTSEYKHCDGECVEKTQAPLNGTLKVQLGPH